MTRAFLMSKIVLLLTLSTSCRTSQISKLHKAKILDVTMDAAKTQAPIRSASMRAIEIWEKSAPKLTLDLGSSCPTCAN